MDAHSTQRSTIPRAPQISLLWGLVTAALLPISATAVELTLSNGNHEISQLEIGDDLWVQAHHSLPHETVILSLWDDQGLMVASKQVDVGPRGATTPILLWFRSGVVGCDEPSDIDILQHRFPNFEQAETLLADRVFEVRAENEHGRTLETSPLPLTVAAKPRYFFSGINGCPRTVYKDAETIYLSALDAKPGSSYTAIYLVDPAAPLTPSGQIQEVRPTFLENPQLLSPAAGAASWTTKLWNGTDSVPGDYGAILTCIPAGPTPPMAKTCSLSAAGSQYIITRQEHGITIKDWSCEEEACEGS